MKKDAYRKHLEQKELYIITPSERARAWKRDGDQIYNKLTGERRMIQKIRKPLSMSWEQFKVLMNIDSAEGAELLLAEDWNTLELMVLSILQIQQANQGKCSKGMKNFLEYVGYYI